MTEIDEIRIKVIDDEGRCNCELANAHHPTLGWICGLTRRKDTPPKTCWEMCGSAECQKHAYRDITTIRHTANPIFTEFIDTIPEYVEVVR